MVESDAPLGVEPTESRSSFLETVVGVYQLRLVPDPYLPNKNLGPLIEAGLKLYEEDE